MKDIVIKNIYNTISLGNKSFTEARAQVISNKENKYVKEVDYSDIIAGQSEDEALKVFETFSDGLV